MTNSSWTRPLFTIHNRGPSYVCCSHMFPLKTNWFEPFLFICYHRLYENSEFGFSENKWWAAQYYSHKCRAEVKFIYSENATKFYEIFTVLLSYVVPVKSKVKISQNFVVFSEYMNFMNTFAKLEKISRENAKKCLLLGLAAGPLGTFCLLRNLGNVPAPLGSSIPLSSRTSSVSSDKK